MPTIFSGTMGKAKHLTGKIFFLCLAAGIVTSSFGVSTLSVKVDSAQYTVSPRLYSLLMERLGKNWVGGVFVGTSSSISNTNGMRNDIINGMKECGVGGIEWPGGCAANGYSWSNNTNPTKDVGTDRFMQLCSLVTCEPILAIPPYKDSAASSKRWVKYINNNTTHPSWTVKYVKIGNEVWGCGGSMTYATYEPNYIANHDSLVTPINGKSLSFIAGTDGIWRYTAWLDTMMRKHSSIINGVEIHDYIYYPSEIPCTGFTGAQYVSVLNAANKGQIAPRLTGIDAVMTKYDPTKKVKVIEDEWGDWFKPYSSSTFTSDGWLQQVTVMDALSAAQQLHLFMQHADRWDVACLAQGVNCIQSLFVTKPSGDSALAKTSTFYIFKMFIPHHSAGAKWAPSTLTSDKFASYDAVTAGTTVDTLGRVNISLSNIDTLKTDTVNITLNSSKTSYSVNLAQIVTGPKKDSFNNWGAAEIVNIQTLAASNYSISGKTLTVRVPPMSIVMLQLGQPTGITTTKPFSVSNEKAFSIKAGSNGAVRITSAYVQDKPVTISLLNVEGKLLERTSRTFTANSAIEFKSNLKSNGMYIVKVESATGSFSKNLIITR
jgi:alpha-L-arabinofuranosidase